MLEKKYAGKEADYKRVIRANARALWGGYTDMVGFTVNMTSTIKRGLTTAWYEGASLCGINSLELNSEEYAALQQSINTELGRVIGFAQYIEKHSKKSGGKVSTALARADMWGGSYATVRSKAMTMACADRKLKWVLGATKVHCRDCLNLSGRVYRASVWRKYDVHPRHWDLECRGKYCLCEFVITNEPATPGFPPRLSGR